MANKFFRVANRIINAKTPATLTATLLKSKNRASPGFFMPNLGWDIMLKDFGTAACLLLVLEGIIPFLSPAKWRNMVEVLAQVDDRTMRLVGFASMLIGAGLLFLLR